jgi:hypothetical protein
VSFPFKSGRMAFDWISVGVVYPMLRRPFVRVGLRLSSSKEVIVVVKLEVEVVLGVLVGVVKGLGCVWGVGELLIMSRL